MEKMTYVQALANAIDVLSAMEDYGETVERLKALKASTEKRNTTKSKAEVAKQETNDALKSVILEVLATCTDPVTITEMLALDERFNGLKVQKVSPLMRALLSEGKVKREEMKHKAYFSLA